MRIANQNRHRATRVRAWSRETDFPRLPEQGVTTAAAEALLNELGGLHVFLVRDTDGTVWAGYTIGDLDDDGGRLPFAPLLSSRHPGGYWRAEGTTGSGA